MRSLLRLMLIILVVPLARDAHADERTAVEVRIARIVGALMHTKVTDDGLKELESHRSLKTLILFGAGVTDAGRRKILSVQPEFNIQM